MRSLRLVPTLLAALVTVGAARSAAAQMIHGRLLQEGTLVPLANASVQLMDARGDELNRLVVTNEAGTFAMRVEPGSYTLRIRRIGFTPLTTPVISLEANEVFEGTYRVSPATIRLATERITAKRSLELGRDGFFRRKELGKGVFLARTDLADKDQRDFSFLMRGIDGIRVEATGRILSTEGWRCLYFMVNKVPVSSVPGSVPGSTMWPTLEDLVPTGHDVMAIEVYREFSEVPAEFRLDAWPGAKPGQRAVPNTASIGRRGAEGPCGLVSIWTRAAW
jgi:carboxypeptidase family protein